MRVATRTDHTYYITPTDHCRLLPVTTSCHRWWVELSQKEGFSLVKVYLPAGTYQQYVPATHRGGFSLGFRVRHYQLPSVQGLGFRVRV